MLLDRARHRAPWIIAAILLCLLSLRSFDQIAVWHDTESLANHVLELDPQSVTGHKIIAAAYSARGDFDRAESHYLAAIHLFTADPRPSDAAILFDYGNLLLRTARPREAIPIYQRAIPDMPPFQRAMACNNLGAALHQIGDIAGARQQFIEALSLRPDYADAKNNLALIDGK
jgi:Flp pilus assembly protein TadD